MKSTHITVAVLALSLSASSLKAQQTTTKTQAAAASSVQKAPTDPSLTKEQMFTKCLAITNQEQVQFSRFAKEKSSREDVKAFAGALEKAHQGFLDELKGMTAKAALTQSPSRDASTGDIAKAPSIDFLQLHQEMADQYLQDSKAMLNKKEGIDFDRCFVGMQVARHAWMHSSLTVLQRHTSGDLQSAVKESLAMNTEHMQASIRLMEQLSESADAKGEASSK